MSTETRAAQNTLLAPQQLHRQEAILKETYNPADRKSQLHQVVVATQAVADARLRQRVEAEGRQASGIRNPTLNVHIETQKHHERMASAQAALVWEIAEEAKVEPATDFYSQITSVVIIMISRLFFP